MSTSTLEAKLEARGSGRTEAEIVEQFITDAKSRIPLVKIGDQVMVSRVRGEPTEMGIVTDINRQDPGRITVMHLFKTGAPEPLPDLYWAEHWKFTTSPPGWQGGNGIWEVSDQLISSLRLGALEKRLADLEKRESKPKLTQRGRAGK